jgi:hypothetical protein
MYPEYVNQLSTMYMTGEEEMPEPREDEDDAYDQYHAND